MKTASNVARRIFVHMRSNYCAKELNRNSRLDCERYFTQLIEQFRDTAVAEAMDEFRETLNDHWEYTKSLGGTNVGWSAFVMDKLNPEENPK